MSIGSCCVLSGEGLVARLIIFDVVGGSAVDLDEIDSESRRRDCGFSAEMIDLREIVEPVLRLEDVDKDTDDWEPEVLVERRWSEMIGIDEGDSFGCGVVVGVRLEVSVGGSRTAVNLPFLLILKSPDHTRRGELSSERRRTYRKEGQSKTRID